MMVCTQKNAVILKGLLLVFSLILEVTKIAKFCMKNRYLFAVLMYIFAKRFMKLCGHQKLNGLFIVLLYQRSRDEIWTGYFL